MIGRSFDGAVGWLRKIKIEAESASLFFFLFLSMGKGGRVQLCLPTPLSLSKVCVPGPAGQELCTGVGPLGSWQVGRLAGSTNGTSNCSSSLAPACPGHGSPLLPRNCIRQGRGARVRDAYIRGRLFLPGYYQERHYPHRTNIHRYISTYMVLSRPITAHIFKASSIWRYLQPSIS
ncbi:hypothetical protein F5X96DRAFT_416188 [Biscogniauxia mediterranea]|nr:hypothetical protein F5X96DRAFT_416188 [Biscogniauxia mediterranea]